MGNASRKPTPDVKGCSAAWTSGRARYGWNADTATPGRPLASRQLSLTEAEPWMDHLGKCSPCFRDYTELRRLADRRRKLTYLGIAAVVVVAALSVWAWRSRQPKVITAHNHIVADMRNLDPPRNKAPARGRMCLSGDLTTCRSISPKGTGPVHMRSGSSRRSQRAASERNGDGNNREWDDPNEGHSGPVANRSRILPGGYPSAGS